MSAKQAQIYDMYRIESTILAFCHYHQKFIHVKQPVIFGIESENESLHKVLRTIRIKQSKKNVQLQRSQYLILSVSCTKGTLKLFY